MKLYHRDMEYLRYGVSEIWDVVLCVVVQLGTIGPEYPEFTGFVFKLQANLNPKHRCAAREPPSV